MTRKTTPTFIAEFELLEGSPGAFGVVDRVESLARSLTNGEVPEPVCSVKDPRRGEMAVCAIITTGRFYGATYDQAGRA